MRGSAWRGPVCFVAWHQQRPGCRRLAQCEYHGWHSIFYFSLPMAGFIFLADGALCFARRRRERNEPGLDFFGLATFSLGVLGLQMMLDRGERLEWFAFE